MARVLLLAMFVAVAAPGTKVDVVVLRDGERETKRVTIEELADEPTEQAAVPPGDERGSTDFGFDIADVPPALRERLGLGREGGAVVTQVHGGGPAIK